MPCEIQMKVLVTPLLALFAAVVLLALAIPAGVTAQNSACNPQVQTCL
jgi:hypothetical protein